MDQQNKDLYRKSCKEGLGIPIFHQPDWLDAACGTGNWQVAIAKDEHRIIAALPITISRKWSLRLSLMPRLTPYLGVWYNPNFSWDKKQSRQVQTTLFEQLPTLDLLAIRNAPGVEGSLDWIWQDWELETKYTLEINQEQSIALEDLKGSLRNDIKKAAAVLVLNQRQDLAALYALVQESFHRNKAKVPFSEEELSDFHKIIQKNKWGKILFAENEKGEIVSGHYFIWDNSCVYNWISGYKKSANTRGATQFILHEGIKSAHAANKSFDFEGGLIPGIGNMYKSFPVQEVPYLVARKFKNKWIKSLWSLRG